MARLILLLTVAQVITSTIWLAGCLSWRSSEQARLAARSKAGEDTTSVARAVRSARNRAIFAPIWQLAAVVLIVASLTRSSK